MKREPQFFTKNAEEDIVEESVSFDNLLSEIKIAVEKKDWSKYDKVYDQLSDPSGLQEEFFNLGEERCTSLKELIELISQYNELIPPANIQKKRVHILPSIKKTADCIYLSLERYEESLLRIEPREVFQKILNFANCKENDEFDIKARDIRSTALIKHIIGFLNGKKGEGYLIIGFDDISNAEKLDAKKERVNKKPETDATEKFEENAKIDTKNLRSKESTFELNAHCLIDTDYIDSLSKTYLKDINDKYKKKNSWIANIYNYEKNDINISKVKNYLTGYAASIFADMQKHSTNWPSEKILQKQLLQIIPIPVKPGANGTLEYDESSEKFIIVLKINRSKFRPHAYVDDSKDKQSNPKYYIRRQKRLYASPQTDGCTELMMPEELRSEMHQLTMRSCNKEVSPRYTVYGELAQNLFTYVTKGEKEKVSELLKEYPGLIVSRDYSGHSILHYAIWYIKNNIVGMLIKEHGMSLYHSDDDGITPLLACCCCGNTEIIEMILKEDENAVYQRDRLGNDVFTTSCLYDSIGLVHYFASNFKDSFYRTKNYQKEDVLQTAVYGCALETTKWLLENHEWTYEELKKAIAIAKDYKEDCQNKPEIQGRYDGYKKLEILLDSKLATLVGVTTLVKSVGFCYGGSSQTATQTQKVLPQTLQWSEKF